MRTILLTATAMMIASVAGSAFATETSPKAPLPHRKSLAQEQTALLNELGGMGYARIVDLRKVGDGYVARVETTEGTSVIVDLDPHTGKLSPRP